MMDAGINNVIYMELNSGPKIANSTCGKTIVAGTIDQVPLLLLLLFFFFLVSVIVLMWVAYKQSC